MDMLHDAGHPAVIARLLHDFDLHPKKSAGQNFFCDAGLLEKMADSAAIEADDWVLEIGPGLGALTQRLAARAARVIAVELDADLLPVLHETLAPFENVQVVQGDFLKLSDEALGKLFSGAPRVRMVSNLPYCITNDAMQKLLLSALAPASITALVQKEAAQRLLAQPGEKQYGITSMMCAYYCQGRILYDVPPECFFPRPGVTSAVLDLRMRMRTPRPAAACSQRFLWHVARSALAMRRKTIRNNLSAAGFDAAVVKSALAKSEIEEGVRAEMLDIWTIQRLAEAIFAQIEP